MDLYFLLHVFIFSKRYFDLFEIFLSPIITNNTASFDLALFAI